MSPSKTLSVLTRTGAFILGESSQQICSLFFALISGFCFSFFGFGFFSFLIFFVFVFLFFYFLFYFVIVVVAVFIFCLFFFFFKKTTFQKHN